MMPILVVVPVVSPAAVLILVPISAVAPILMRVLTSGADSSSDPSGGYSAFPTYTTDAPDASDDASAGLGATATYTFGTSIATQADATIAYVTLWQSGTAPGATTVYVPIAAPTYMPEISTTISVDCTVNAATATQYAIPAQTGTDGCTIVPGQTEIQYEYKVPYDSQLDIRIRTKGDFGDCRLPIDQYYAYISSDATGSISELSLSDVRGVDGLFKSSVTGIPTGNYEIHVIIGGIDIWTPCSIYKKGDAGNRLNQPDTLFTDGSADASVEVSAPSSTGSSTTTNTADVAVGASFSTASVVALASTLPLSTLNLPDSSTASTMHMSYLVQAALAIGISAILVWTATPRLYIV